MAEGGANMQVTRSILQDERIKSYINTFRTMSQRHVDEIKDPSSILATEFKYVNPEMFDRYPDSPTAKKYLTAFKMYISGFSCLLEYKKLGVDKNSDCDFLEPGFKAYAFGYVLENLMVCQFPPPKHVDDLLDQYLVKRPNDLFAAYFKMRRDIRDQSSTQRMGQNIIACEKVANTFRSKSLSSEENFILSDIYAVMASLYTITKQRLRAVDSFENALKFNECHTDAIYGIGFNTDGERAEASYQKYLQLAPKCDKKYPNVLYQLCLIYIEKNNISKAVQYFEWAKLSESRRLPFLPKVDIDAKTIAIQSIPLVRQSVICYNPDCSACSDSRDIKKCSRCKKISYCSRECQKQDWQFHRQLCFISE